MNSKTYSMALLTLIVTALLMSCNKKSLLSTCSASYNSSFYDENIIRSANSFFSRYRERTFYVKQDSFNLILFNAFEEPVPQDRLQFGKQFIQPIAAKFTNEVLKEPLQKNKFLLNGNLVFQVIFLESSNSTVQLNYIYPIEKLVLFPM